MKAIVRILCLFSHRWSYGESRQWRECARCGVRERACPKCNGKGCCYIKSGPCRACDGSGVYYPGAKDGHPDCPSCAGTGVWEDCLVDCEDCQGKGWRPEGSKLPGPL